MGFRKDLAYHLWDGHDLVSLSTYPALVENELRGMSNKHFQTAVQMSNNADAISSGANIVDPFRTESSHRDHQASRFQNRGLTLSVPPLPTDNLFLRGFCNQAVRHVR